MGVRVLILIALVLPRLAYAEVDVDIVVAGRDSVITDATRAAGASWLTTRGFKVTKSLPPAGATTLSDCLLVPDMKCARGVVEARGMGGGVIAVLTQAYGNGAHRSIQLSVYWISKGSDVVSVQKMCDSCSDQALPVTVTALMADVSKLVPTMRGRIKITTSPSGVLALVDGAPIGTTPVDHEVAPGVHEIAMTRNGETIATSHVAVSPGATAEVDIPIPALPVVVVAPKSEPVVIHHSKAVPATVLVLGGAAIATGLVLYKVGGPTGDSFYYTNLRTPGIGIAAGGGALAILGAIWLVKSGRSGGPTVSVSAGSAVAGWTRSF